MVSVILYILGFIISTSVSFVLVAITVGIAIDLFRKPTLGRLFQTGLIGTFALMFILLDVWCGNYLWAVFNNFILAR